MKVETPVDVILRDIMNALHENMILRAFIVEYFSFTHKHSHESHTEVSYETPTRMLIIQTVFWLLNNYSLFFCTSYPVYDYTTTRICYCRIYTC